MVPLVALVIFFMVMRRVPAVVMDVHGHSYNFTRVESGIRLPPKQLMGLGEGKVIDAATALQINLPTAFSVGVCENVLMKSARYIDCGVWSRRVIPKDLVVAYDVAFLVFQHDYINGIPSAGMLLQWVLQDLEERMFLCSTRVCDILRFSVPASSLVDIKDVTFPLSARSVRVAAVDWLPSNLTWDTYPGGSVAPVDTYLRQFAKPVTKPLIIFLSLGISI